jgi:hypothetical protein
MSGNTLTIPLKPSGAAFLSKTAPNQFRVTLNPAQFSNFNGVCTKSD